MTARSRAGQNSFVLGKHNWTISGDNYQCSKDRDYEIELKLTGCKEDEFTCDEGQCVQIAERCDHVTQCEDESDERNCKVLVLQHGYNKKVPPLVARNKKTGSKDPLTVKVNLTLQKLSPLKKSTTRSASSS